MNNNNYHTQLENNKNNKNILNEAAANYKLFQQKNIKEGFNPIINTNSNHNPRKSIDKEVELSDVVEFEPNSFFQQGNHIEQENNIPQNLNLPSNTTHFSKNNENTEYFQGTHSEPSQGHHIGENKESLRDPQQNNPNITQRVSPSISGQNVRVNIPYREKDLNIKLHDTKLGNNNIIPINYSKEYLIFPAIIFILFIIFTYPKISKIILRDYFPAMKNLTGFLVRGLLIILSFVIIKWLINQIWK